jgi:DNA invertase Pin-like site-specific DNA recombinase
MQYGYGRVSTNMQDTALQEDAFKRARVRRVISEKWSSVGARPQLQALLLRLKPGDELVVYKLDRLGRSLQDLLAILDKISASGAAFRSLTEPIDTRTAAGKLMYSVLGAVAEFERSMIKERAIAGQVAAWQRGVRWGGQPRALNLEDTQEMYRLRDLGIFTIPMLAEMFGCSSATVDRALARRRDPNKFARRRLPVLGAYLNA